MKRDLQGVSAMVVLTFPLQQILQLLYLVFPPTEDDEHYYVLPYFWLPEETLPLRVRRDHVPYDVWERQGYLKTTEGNVVHYGFIENFIDELGQQISYQRDSI